MAELTQRRTLLYAGGALVAAGLFLWGSQQKAVAPSSSPKPSPSPSPAPKPTTTPQPPATGWPTVVMGSGWINRAGWVRDHGNYGPLYKADGSGLVRWVPFGERLQTTGPAGNFTACYIAPNGQTCCPTPGMGYPVAGGYVGLADVIPG